MQPYTRSSIAIVFTFLILSAIIAIHIAIEDGSINASTYIDEKNRNLAGFVANIKQSSKEIIDAKKNNDLDAANRVYSQSIVSTIPVDILDHNKIQTLYKEIYWKKFTHKGTEYFLLEIPPYTIQRKPSVVYASFSNLVCANEKETHLCKQIHDYKNMRSMKEIGFGYSEDFLTALDNQISSQSKNQYKTTILVI